MGLVTFFHCTFTFCTYFFRRNITVTLPFFGRFLFYKTKHRSFTVGMPLILLLWIIGLSFLLYVRYTHP